MYSEKDYPTFVSDGLKPKFPQIPGLSIIEAKHDVCFELSISLHDYEKCKPQILISVFSCSAMKRDALTHYTLTYRSSSMYVHLLYSLVIEVDYASVCLVITYYLF